MHWAKVQHFLEGNLGKGYEGNVGRNQLHVTQKKEQEKAKSCEAAMRGGKQDGDKKSIYFLSFLGRNYETLGDD